MKKWACLDSDTGEDSAFIKFRRDKLAEEVRKYHIPDFSNWKSLRTATNDAFARAFARLKKICALQLELRDRINKIFQDYPTSVF